MRTRRIARTRAMAALTDRAPAILGVVSGATLLLGAAALVGAWATGKVPGRAAAGAPDFVASAAQAAQALGSWLIGVGFILFVTWGRRAYRDPAAAAPSASSGTSAPSGRAPPTPSRRPATPSGPSPT